MDKEAGRWVWEIATAAVLQIAAEMESGVSANEERRVEEIRVERFEGQAGEDHRP